MEAHTLDFTHSLNGRHTALAPVPVNQYAKQLETELANGGLPFVTLPHAAALHDLDRVFDRCPKARHLLLLGIGGSALGARALQKAFAPEQDGPGVNPDSRRLWVADNVDATQLAAWLAALPPEKTLVAVISKSGGTLETMAQYFLVRAWLKQRLGGAWTDHVIIITDPEKGPLRKEARDHSITALEVPPALGGRYSIFSAVGLLPAAFLGLDWKKFLKGAIDAGQAAQNPQSLASCPGWQLAHWAYSLTLNNYDQLVFFSYIPHWQCLGAWFAQLWAESLGKSGKGSMPIPAVGVTDQHSLLQMFLDGPPNRGCLFISGPNLPAGAPFDTEIPDQWSWLQGRNFGDLLQAEAIGTRMALVSSKVPLTHIRMGTYDEEAFGRIMALLMQATLFTGWLLDINPLDQPAVELGKRLANANLGAPGYTEEAKHLRRFLGTEDNAGAVKF